MKRAPVYMVLVLFTAVLSTAASAGSPLQPEKMRIVAIEVGKTPNWLRLGVRKNIRFWLGAFQDTDFNPNSCEDTRTDEFEVPGIDLDPQRQLHYVDIQLNAPGRSAEEQRRLLNAVLAAFMTSRNAQLFVRDDLCSPSGGRVAAGIKVEN